MADINIGKLNINKTEACATCGATTTPVGSGLSRCSKCKRQFYCSKACQQKDWPSHKPACKLMVEFAEPLSEPLPTAKATSKPPPPYKPAEKAGPPELHAPIPDGLIYAGIGIAIMPARYPWSETTGVTTMAVLSSPFLTKPGWLDLPVTKALGFPLRLISTLDGNETLPNHYIPTLGIETDSESPKFGQSSLPPKPKGNALVVRVDRKPLHMSHLDALFAYIRQRLTELKKVKKKEAAGKKVDRTRHSGRR